MFEVMSLGEIVKEVKTEKDKRNTLLVGTLVPRIVDFLSLSGIQDVEARCEMLISLGLPAGTMINCADNTGAKNLYIIFVKAINE